MISDPEIHNTPHAAVAPPPLPEAMIEVHHLRREFGNVLAVADVSFTIYRGQKVGFIGANGAGKTTTLRMLATLDLPDAGEIRVAGIDALDQPSALRGRLGWMPDSVGVYPDMTVMDYLDFFARASGLRGNLRRDRLREVMEFTDLLSISDRDVRKLSKGMGQRLCLGRTLLHDPEVLLLDEPAAGLDPKARIEFRNLIDHLAEQGKTILISSHILSELGEMCDTLLFMDGGRIVRHATMADLVSGDSEGLHYEVQIAGSESVLVDWIETQPNLALHNRAGNRITLRIPERANESAAAILARMVRAGLPVCEFRRSEKRLEQVFVDMVKKGGAQ